MKRNVHSKLLAAVLLTVVTTGTMVACGSKQASDTVGQTEITQSEEGHTTSAQTTDTVETTQAQQDSMDNTVAANAEGAVGVSANGYTIQNIEGVTYVNGIMIVNKTYSLPETYNPAGVSQEVLDAFAKMQADATAAGLNIWIQSSFRTYEYQEYLYNMYVSSDGKAAADTYSARPGFSEHQSGLCFDLNSIDDTFTDTPEGQWVDAHAHEYGFIIRFPKGKESITGYKYESWHLRYVGVDIATTMYNNNMCLEEYLGVTSQYAD